VRELLGRGGNAVKSGECRLQACGLVRRRLKPRAGVCGAPHRPINTARRGLNQLREQARSSSTTSASSARDLNAHLAPHAIGLPDKQGALVEQAAESGLAAKAGIRGGGVRAELDGQPVLLGRDVIVKLAGLEIATMTDLVSAVDARKVNEKVTVGIRRARQAAVDPDHLGPRPDSVRN
jgi:S1-C subfamily serine protease